jgi:hypothetical protein
MSERDTFDGGPGTGGRVPRDWPRVVSLVVAIIYLVINAWAFPHKSLTHLVVSTLLTMIGLAFPLACIWFGDEMGEYVGSSFRPITKPTPGVFVRLGGWVLLSLPALIGLIIWWIDWRLLK